ncbi:ATP-dependent Clp protease proteolytic subunit [Rhodothalassium salexigens]|uniref:ATP-dependent Clp protease proteolytic subunit n=1 Tax=Rhodothalassium salexigens TaxID=1086 RepID=UPI001912550E|nr:ATP-dependent Clp protease proteolytic subunit [Rhodothalassium salexigens]MBK5912638.1 ATP-dependent Clp protease proteolytic subunit [Rhodothalassium salexigens]
MNSKGRRAYALALERSPCHITQNPFPENATEIEDRMTKSVIQNRPSLDDEEEEKPDNRETPNFIEKHLFKRRHVLITGGVDDKLARVTCERLLALAAESSDPINVFVSSPGGHVESGDMIHDMIRFIDCPVRTIGTGWVASAGALIFAAPPRENRLCLPNTRFLLHQPSGGMGGSASDVAIQAEQIIKMRHRLNLIFAEATGQPLERIEKDTDRDHWLTPEEALDYGLLGRVVQTTRDIG